MWGFYFEGSEYGFYCCGDVLQVCGDFTWRVSDCEELVGLLTGDDGVDRGDFTWRVVNMDLKC